VDAAIAQLLAFCQADPVFFEPPWRMDDRDSSIRGLRGVRLPTGWWAQEEGVWVLLYPEYVPLPEQGWKIHISATLADADQACDRVLKYCVNNDVAVKYLRSKAAMQLLNSKYADRRSSGKLITVYPVDDTQLAELLAVFAEMLKDITGPYILSDLRYQNSCVYVRYGGFKKMTCVGPDGDKVYAVRAPDGRLVPDERGVMFSVPEWVSVPEVLRESLERRNAGDGGEFPFQIERPLHFSNGGGVYLARDRDSGRYVVLREARPHAGLDRDGLDAVTRLRREHGFLERLRGLDCVPRVFEHRVIWEHHFLVEEYVEGRTLMEEVFDRYPLVHPDPSPEDTDAYTQWATNMLAKVDHALMSVHARGVRFADLHPANIMVRQDGRVVLIDFEIASDLDDPKPLSLGAPGFTAPAGITGRDADDYVLNCLRQWMFLPISPLQDRDPAKRASLTAVIAEHFPVPEGFAARMVRRFSVRKPLGEDVAARRFDDPDWPQLRESMVAAILASATPDRKDRLYPADPHQHMTGGITVDHGAAGVLWALRQVGVTPPEDHVDWLVTAARQYQEPRPGLLDGLYGVAATLETLGRREDALDILERAGKLRDDLVTPGIHSGLAGAGFALLHFADATGDEGLRTEAVDIGENLAAHLHDEASPMFTSRVGVGLQRGLTGVALYFMRLYETTGDARYLGLARQALRRETGNGQVLPDGTYQLLETNRYQAYLGTGSIGLGLALARYLRHDGDEAEFSGVIDGARRACRATFVRHPFLLMGRAGTIAALTLLGVPEDRPTIADHVRRLGWHALSYQGHLAFPGNQMLRLSMDLATGTAGVLVALGVAFGQHTSVIPVVDVGPPAFEATERR